MSPTFGAIVSKLLAGAMALITCFINPFAMLSKTMPKTPDGFLPVLRFVVASDVHINDEEEQTEKDRLKAFINTSYDLAAASETSYKELDAVCFAGDVTNTGKDVEAQYFIDICKANVRGDTQLLNIMGNHDMYGSDEPVQRFESIFETDLNYHVTIKGYHFIGISYAPGTTYETAEKKTWLNAQIKSAVSDGKDKPVFVFQHPHPFGTVYGSVNWGDLTTANIYNKYSQVVAFSGHSHYPINDPRSLWQGSYTSIGTGTLSYFEMEKDGSAGQFPDGYTDAAQFRMVEVDADGNVRVRNYDLITNSYFGEDYYLTDFADKSKFAYTSKNRKLGDPAPEFAAGSKVAVSLNDAGETVVSFPAATDRYIVHDYKVVVKNKLGITVYSGSTMSHYYLNKAFSTEEFSLGKFVTDGKDGCKVYVTAQNAYGKLSKTIAN